MRIAVGSDHRGCVLKEGLLGELGHEWVDFGCQSEEAVNYPDIVRFAALLAPLGAALVAVTAGARYARRRWGR
jgi:ribose 5-phosphate isomerase RpiB